MEAKQYPLTVADFALPDYIGGEPVRYTGETVTVAGGTFHKFVYTEKAGGGEQASPADRFARYCRDLDRQRQQQAEFARLHEKRCSACGTVYRGSACTCFDNGCQ